MLRKSVLPKLNAIVLKIEPSCPCLSFTAALPPQKPDGPKTPGQQVLLPFGVMNPSRLQSRSMPPECARTTSALRAVPSEKLLYARPHRVSRLVQSRLSKQWPLLTPLQAHPPLQDDVQRPCMQRLLVCLQCTWFASESLLTTRHPTDLLNLQWPCLMMGCLWPSS